MSTVKIAPNVYFYKTPPVVYDGGMKTKPAGISVKALKWAMKHSGLSQEKLAKASEVNKATISRLLKGEVEGITASNVANLANAMKVSIDFLMGRTTNPEVTPSIDLAIAEIVAIAKTLPEFRQRDLLLIAQTYRDADAPRDESLKKILDIVEEIADEATRKRLAESLDSPPSPPAGE